MRTLKNIIIGLVVIIVILVVISLFLPSMVHVERSMVVHGQPSVVFEQVNDLKKWPNWSPWHRKDPKMQIVYSDVSSGAGSMYTWKSDKSDVGNGTMKITASIPNDSINTEMNFMEHGTATGGFKFAPAEGGTKVTWSMESDMGMNPIGKIFGLMMDKMVGPDFEKGLKNLDSVAATIKPAPSFDIQATTVTSSPAIAIRDSSDMKNMSDKYMKLYSELGDYMKKNKLGQNGAPFSITYSYTPEKMVFAAGIPTDKLGKGNGNIQAINTPAGNAVVLKYHGNYNNMNAAYGAINKWITDNKKTITGLSWEVYIAIPGTEKDTAKWLTEIYYPVK